MIVAPFSKEAIELLKRLGFKYLVVDRAVLTAYARREHTPKEQLELLNLSEYDLFDLNLKTLNFNLDKVEVPHD